LHYRVPPNRPGTYIISVDARAKIFRRYTPDILRPAVYNEKYNVHTPEIMRHSGTSN
jgi:hypothetical protein